MPFLSTFSNHLGPAVQSNQTMSVRSTCFYFLPQGNNKAAGKCNDIDEKKKEKACMASLIVDCLGSMAEVYG